MVLLVQVLRMENEGVESVPIVLADRVEDPLAAVGIVVVVVVDAAVAVVAVVAVAIGIDRVNP
jgi:hypothetical protein